MVSLPPFVTARELLDQLVDALQVKPEEGRLGQPCDCEYMRLLTDATNPYPLHLVNGADYLSWVTKYGYYFSTQGMKTAFLCLESRPLTSLLALISLQSGIPQHDLFSLQVCRSHFEVLNQALEELYIANPLFFESSRLDLDELIALIRHLKKHEDVETVMIDALHRVRSEKDKSSTSTEQSRIASVLRSTAHIARLHIVAGFHDAHIPFPTLPADSVLYCGAEGDEAVNTEPRRIAIAGLVMAKMQQFIAFCGSILRYFTSA